MQKYNVIIIGGGPAGATCALRLIGSGLKVLILDKAKFPRDKICGDALSVDVVNQLPIVSSKVFEKFTFLENKLPSWGVSIFSPENRRLDIPFKHKKESKSGFICARKDFDNILFQEVKNAWQIDVKEDCTVTTILYGKSNVIVHTANEVFSADFVVGADGANSIVRRSFLSEPISKKHHSAGLRIYYEGVINFHQQNFIELYFISSILPGYLWVFPMSGNKANVGIGLLSSTVSKNKINLKQVLENELKSHPLLKDRFANASPLETVKGFGLPLGSKKRTLSGDRFLLLGDAAGLIDPFSGEGIGNAIRSGRVAAEHIISSFKYENFSAGYNSAFDKEIYRRMNNEFKISYALQKLCNYPTLFNFVIRKAAKSIYWQNFFMEALSDINQKKKLLNPLFYYNLLFK